MSKLSPRSSIKKMPKGRSEIRVSPRRRRVLIPITKTVSAPGKLETGNNMRVVVRVRPSNSREGGDNSRIVIKIIDKTMLIFDPKEDITPFFYHGVQQRGRDFMKRSNKDMKFMFDSVFGFDSNNEDVFEDSTKSLIQSLMDGYNCSVFVYGATGAGKTFTMLGNGECPGITFLTMAELFNHKKLLSTERDFELGISYLEVYNETVQDLLVPGKPLHLREDGKFGVIVSGIEIKRIINPEELFSLLEHGNRNRTQHPTDANEESSRSHAVFQVYIRMNIRTTGEVRVSKLSMIDLAGSERGAATGCAGARFTEGANINKSLLALGNCINSLADKKKHIPYRDSKLTRLLKDSLGGSCRTVMIANISPTSLTYEDTLNTLKYATRAKQIKSHMKKNVVNGALQISQYVRMVDELTKEVDRLKTELQARDSQLTTTTTSATLTVSCTCNTVETPSSTTISSIPSCEVPSEELRAIVDERHVVQEKLLGLKHHEQYLVARAELKKTADSRLSGLCTDTPEKEEGHKRIQTTVSCLQKQADCLQEDIAALNDKKDELEMQVQNILNDSEDVQVKMFIELANGKLERLAAEQQAKHLQKVVDLQVNALKMRDEILGHMSNVLQPCFWALRGHGHATEAMAREYKSLVRSLQGIRSITWDESITFASFDPAVHFLCKPIEVIPIKGKLDDPEPHDALNSTYVVEDESENLPLPSRSVPMNKPRAPRIVLGECMVRENINVNKVPSKSPVLNKHRSGIHSASPRIKDNKIVKIRPTGTMGTSQRFALPCKSPVLKATAARNRLKSTIPGQSQPITTLQHRKKIL